MQRVRTMAELPPMHAGLSAALRRAFKEPADDRSCDFDALLRKMA